MSEWQPIESAPKGETVLIFMKNSARCGNSYYVADQRDDGFWNIGKGRKRTVHPTHWKRLDPPA